MYAYLKGLLIDREPNSVIVEVSGIGFRLFVPVQIKLPAVGAEVKLHTSQRIREDAVVLYGFESRAQCDLFEQLTEVSGVGPKLALALLSGLSTAELHRALLNGDVRTLSSVPGIGRRTAERLTVDLRGKLSHLSDQSTTPTLSDALSALMNLGYTPASARRAVEESMQELSENASLSDLVSAALRRMAS